MVMIVRLLGCFFRRRGTTVFNGLTKIKCVSLAQQRLVLRWTTFIIRGTAHGGGEAGDSSVDACMYVNKQKREHYTINNHGYADLT